MKLKILIPLLIAIILIVVISCDESTQTENNPPLCTIISPEDEMEFEKADSIEILVEAADTDGKIEEVEFFIDGILVYTTTQSPYIYTWDTEFIEMGNHTILATAEDNDGETASDEIRVYLTEQNIPPNACFSYLVDGKIVEFDASCCSDFQDDSKTLTVRWDWNGDGTWDTGFRKEKISTHEYAEAGKNRAILEVKDSRRATDTTSAKFRTVITGTVTDIDGNTYKTVKIGNQWWMAENLRVTHYRNGDEIHRVIPASEWDSLHKGAWCYYGHSEDNKDPYGLLYNWYAVDDSGKLAPEGWHIPTNEEWEKLAEFISYDNGNYTKNMYDEWSGVGFYLKSRSGWSSQGNGSDDYNFDGIPSGERGANDHFLGLGGYFAYYWTATKRYLDNAWCRSLYFEDDLLRSAPIKKTYGMSVRCVKDGD